MHTMAEHEAEAVEDGNGAGHESEDSPESFLLQRHKQELKDLRARIQALKKSVPKGDKKRKKEVAAEMARLEQELLEKHEQELKEHVRSNGVGMCSSEVVSEVKMGAWGAVGGGGGGGREREDEEGWKTVSDDDKPVKKSRAQRRKEKKAQLERERQRAREEEEREMALADNPRLRERGNLDSLLERLHLRIIDIQPDGNCLYTAIMDQLSRRLKIESSVARLRTQCAEYVRRHSDDFLPFLTDQKTGDLFTTEQFAQYCSDIENTATWGGQLEIRALSHVYQVTITVYQAESPPIVVGEEYSGSSESLALSYHHHEYGLGEHYNSLASLTSR